MPLELIQYYKSDGSALMWSVMSPGDLDGDGHSELFAYEAAREKRVLVFSGGILPDITPVKIFHGLSPYYRWIPDINSDGYDDFAIRRAYDPDIGEVEIWFGGPDFLEKESHDLLMGSTNDTIEGLGFSTSSGDVNGDGWNDIVMSSINGWIYPYDGRFYIFYGGDILDTIVDEVISIYDLGDGYNNFWIGDGLGDINGDGLLDFGYTAIRPNCPGRMSIIFGSIPLDTLPDITFWDPWQGTNGEDFGLELEPLGDINDDGFDDFAVGGVSMWPCIYYGGNPFDTIPVILDGTSEGLSRGNRIANIGDINGDGRDDIGVGAPFSSMECGKVYIYTGSWDIIDTHVDLKLESYDAYPYCDLHFGESVGSAGDFNGDGIGDVAVSGQLYASGGITYVFVYAGDRSIQTTAADDQIDRDLPPMSSVLYQNYPNPFNSETIIRYSLAGRHDREVSLNIYNLLGEKVRTLKQGFEGGGVHSAKWDGTDDNGAVVSTGIYFSVFKSDGQATSKKMLLLK